MSFALAEGIDGLPNLADRVFGIGDLGCVGWLGRCGRESATLVADAVRQGCAPGYLLNGHEPAPVGVSFFLPKRFIILSGEAGARRR